ncbi:MAG: hypothetical protein H7844_03100 [Nitrospirae bacterium YQR-1]
MNIQQSGKFNQLAPSRIVGRKIGSSPCRSKNSSDKLRCIEFIVSSQLISMIETIDQGTISEFVFVNTVVVYFPEWIIHLGRRRE